LKELKVSGNLIGHHLDKLQDVLAKNSNLELLEMDHVNLPVHFFNFLHQNTTLRELKAMPK